MYQTHPMASQADGDTTAQAVRVSEMFAAWTEAVERWSLSVEEAAESFQRFFADIGWDFAVDEAPGRTLDELIPDIDRVLAELRGERDE